MATHDIQDIEKYSKADYEDLLKNESAWEKYRSHCKANIAIVGAGISGIISGLLLQKVGHTITIFEASRTVGGRIKTIRDGFSSGLYAEAGAMRIPSNHTLTWWLINDYLKLKTVPFKNSSDNNILFINGDRFTISDYTNNPTWMGFPLSDTEKSFIKNEIRNDKGTAAEQLLDKVLIDFIRKIPNFHEFEYSHLSESSLQGHADRTGLVFRELDNFSLRTFLKQQALLNGEKLSPGAVEMICTVMASEMQMQSSMAEVLNDHAEMNDSNLRRISIIGGMDLLPKTLVGITNNGPKSDALSNCVHYSKRVTEIRPATPGIQIVWENPITRRPDHDEFDYVIIAIPFSALRLIYMPGLLEDGKMRAIRQLHYENSCKIFIEFSRRFWEYESPGRVVGTKKMDGGHSITDLPVRQIFYPAKEHSFGRPGGVLLASYTWGDDSLRWTSLKKDDRVRLALQNLALVHNREERARGIRPLEKLFVGGISHSWAEDEFTSGAFATFEPHQFTEFFKDTWKPNGNVHFCGEHASTKHGWIEGAVESGIRAAKEVCEAARDN